MTCAICRRQFDPSAYLLPYRWSLSICRPCAIQADERTNARLASERDNS